MSVPTNQPTNKNIVHLKEQKRFSLELQIFLLFSNNKTQADSIPYFVVRLFFTRLQMCSAP